MISRPCLRKSTGQSASSFATSPSSSSASRSGTNVPCPEYCTASTSPGAAPLTSSRMPRRIASRVAAASVSSVTSNRAARNASAQAWASATQPCRRSPSSGYASTPMQSARRAPATRRHRRRTRDPSGGREVLVLGPRLDGARPPLRERGDVADARDATRDALHGGPVVVEVAVRTGGARHPEPDGVRGEHEVALGRRAREEVGEVGVAREELRHAEDRRRLLRLERGGHEVEQRLVVDAQAGVGALGVVVHGEDGEPRDLAALRVRQHELRERVDAHRGREQAERRDLGDIRLERGRQQVRVEDRPGAVAHGVHLDLAGVLGHPLAEGAHECVPAAALHGCRGRVDLHVVPDPAAAEEPRGDLEERVLRLVDPAATAAGGPPAQRVPERGAESRLPHEVDRVDAVRLPPRGLLHGDAEARLLVDEPAVRVEHDRHRAGRVRGDERRQVGREDRVDVVGGRAEVRTLRRGRRCAWREPAVLEGDDVRTQVGELGGGERGTRRATPRPTGAARSWSRAAGADGLGGRAAFMMAVLPGWVRSSGSRWMRARGCA